MILSPSSSVVVVVCTYVLRTPAHFRVRNVGGGGGGDFDTFQGRMNMEGGTKIGWPQTLPTDRPTTQQRCTAAAADNDSSGGVSEFLYAYMAQLPLSSPLLLRRTDGECTAAAPRRSMASAAPSVPPLLAGGTRRLRPGRGGRVTRAGPLAP